MIESRRSMILPVSMPSFPDIAHYYPVIDVRSPGEYRQGHIPGATNIPLFSDEERAVVGTLYVKNGHDEAILKGLDIALPGVEGYLSALKIICPFGKILLHCWRGGMRSALMAEVFSRAGYEVSVLEGGYKAYRHAIREGLARPARIIILGGYTGTGKTDILRAIASAGEQVIDLERFACHKGSVFGALGQPPQPTNEQFENDLYHQWKDLDFSKPVWMEDESRMIGRVTLPDPLYEQISNGVLIRAGIDREIRIQRLVGEYAGFDKRYLSEAILKISERLGGARTKEALAALEGDRFDEVASIVLAYYDKAYLHSISRRKNKSVHDIRIAGIDAQEDAARIMEFWYQKTDHGADLS